MARNVKKRSPWISYALDLRKTCPVRTGGSKDQQREAKERSTMSQAKRCTRKEHNVAGFSTGNREMGRDTFR